MALPLVACEIFLSPCVAWNWDADLNIQELIAIKKVLQASADLGRFYADLENVELVALKRLFERLKPSQVYKVAFKVSMTVVSLSILLALSCRISVVNSILR